jgi:hypothetical protein
MDHSDAPPTSRRPDPEWATRARRRAVIARALMAADPGRYPTLRDAAPAAVAVVEALEVFEAAR